MIGPIQKTACASNIPDAMAGPNERAGFIDAPVSGPIARMSAATRQADGEAADPWSVGIDSGTEDHPDEEEGRDRLERDRAAKGDRRGDHLPADARCLDGARRKETLERVGGEDRRR